MQRQLIETKPFQKSYRRLASDIRKKVDKQLELLGVDPTYPSLQAHRAEDTGLENVWIGYVSIRERLIYQLTDNSIYLWDVGHHDIVNRLHFRNFNHTKINK